MNIKALIAAGIAAIGLTAGAAMAEQVKIGIAAEPYPPFASLDSSGNWVGWEVDIIKAICTAEQMDCVITPVAWDGIIPSLTGKQIDAIMASMSITDERMKTIDFSDKYYNTPSVIVAAKSSDIAATPEGLAGKILGVQASTIHQAYAQAHLTDAAEIRVYQTQDEINQDLASGRIDAIQADSDSGALQVSAVASPIWEHLDFNLDVPALQDIRVRRAIAHAIDREAMAPFAEILVCSSADASATRRVWRGGDEDLEAP